MRHLSVALPSQFGDLSITVYDQEPGKETVVLSTKRLVPHATPLVRIHSECLTGDTFGSLRCDCGPQKEESLRMIAESGNGIFVYMRQEGRGIGLFEKIKAYQLQEEGHDTHEANILLGHKADAREYSMAKKVLDDFGISTIRLLTNNPSKVSELEHLGITISERIPLIMPTNKHNEKYIETKKEKFGHHFEK